MTESGLARFSTAIATLETVGLIAVEIGNGADFQPTLLGFAIHLEVVADGSGETHIATAETQNAVGQFQFLEQAFHVGQHFLMRLLGVLGLVDAHDFYLGELVQTIQAAHILAITACLATEALRISAVLDGQIFFGDNHIAVDICHGNLGGRNQIEVVEIAMVHLTFLVGQLTRAIARSGIDNGRRHNFNVASLAGLVKEKVDEGALQTSTLSDINGEACARNLYAQIEINEVVLLGEFPVRKGVLGERCVVATCLDDEIVLGSFSLGHEVVGNIRNGVEHLRTGFLCLLLASLQLNCLLLDLLHLLLGGFSLVLLSLFHQGADGFGNILNFRKQRI